MLWMGADNSLTAPMTVTPGKWTFLAATFDGSVFRLYSDGAKVGEGKSCPGYSGSGVADRAAADPVAQWAAFWRQDCRLHADTPSPHWRRNQTVVVATTRFFVALRMKRERNPGEYRPARRLAIVPRKTQRLCRRAVHPSRLLSQNRLLLGALVYRPTVTISGPRRWLADGRSSDGQSQRRKIWRKPDSIAKTG